MTKVLIADPSAEVRSILSKTVGLLGWESRVAADVDTAYQVARQAAPDVVLVEVALPTRGGWELLRALRCDERTMRVPALLISGWPHLTFSPEAHWLHPWSFLSKPFRPAALLQAVGKLLKTGQKQSRLDDTVVVGSLAGHWSNLLSRRVRHRSPRNLRLPHFGSDGDSLSCGSP